MNNPYVLMTTTGMVGVVIAALAAVVLFIVGFNAFRKGKEIEADYVEEEETPIPIGESAATAQSDSEVHEENVVPAPAEAAETSVTKPFISDIELRAILFNENSSTPKKDALEVLMSRNWTKEEATVYVNSFIQRNHYRWNFQLRKYEVRM